MYAVHRAGSLLLTMYAIIVVLTEKPVLDKSGKSARRFPTEGSAKQSIPKIAKELGLHPSELTTLRILKGSTW